MSLQQEPFSPPPPPVITYPTQYPSKDSWGSIGPVIGVLVAIAVLGILAVVIGRLCSGQRIAGLGPYNVQRWIERKCSSCIDGGTGSPSPPATATAPADVARQRSEAEPEAKHSPQN